jgi:soluble lytic murein transglycosylase
LLGWNVGDFNNLRFQSPDIIVPKARPIPPAGSALFQELYQLGQDTEAIALFRSETAKVKDLDVNQQFTQALLYLAQGENLKGINQVWNLKKQDEPENQRQWQALRNNPSYWQALFPIPYDDLIVKWSRDRQLNPLLVTSLIRQESRFEPKIQSPVGATGLMQVMPATAKFVAGQIDLPQYSLTSPNDSINLGTWYLDHTHREYNNNSLLAIASYNAGPGAVSKWRQQYQTTDPDLFVQKIPYAETQGYVETVFGNYWNYLRIYNPEFAQKLAKYTGNPSLVTAPNP